jgi:sn-glycerol 3-phosphate transport system substrate-binding protein
MTTVHRRLLLLLLVPVLLAVACGGGGGGSDGGAAPTSVACPVAALAKATKPVDITFWYSGVKASNVDALKALVAAYDASQQKVHVTAQFQGTYDEASDKYLTALRGGTLPNMVMLEETRLQLMIDSKSLMSATSCADADGYSTADYLKPVLDEFTVDKQLWPMPFNVSNPVLYFDANDFVKAGLDPARPPRTFAEVLDAARKIKSSGAAKTGFAWEMQPWYVEQFFAKAGQPIVDQGNGRDGRATKAAVEGKTGQEIYGFVDQLFKEGLALNVGRNESGTDTLLALGKGDASMAIGTSAALGSIYDIQAAGQFTDVKVGVAPLIGPDAKDGGVTVGGGALFMVGKGKSDLEKAATWDFAKWLDEPQQQATWHKRTGYIPIRKSAVELPEVADLWKQKPAFRVAYDQLVSSGLKIGGPSIGPYKEFRDVIRTSLESLVLKHISPAEALAQAQRDATSELSSYNARVGG